MIHSIINDINYKILGRLYDVIKKVFLVGQLYPNLTFFVIKVFVKVHIIICVRKPLVCMQLRGNLGECLRSPMGATDCNWPFFVCVCSSLKRP